MRNTWLNANVCSYYCEISLILAVDLIWWWFVLVSLWMVSSPLCLGKDHHGLKQSRKLHPGTISFCENYERFNNSNGQDDMQKDVFNIPTMKVSPETSPGPYNNIDGEAEKRKGAFNISPKKAPLKTLHERSVRSKGKIRKVLSISSPRKPFWSSRMLSITSPRKPYCRYSESDSTRATTKPKCRTMFPVFCPRKPQLRTFSLSHSRISMAKVKCRTMFSISSPRKLHCKFWPRRSATNLAKISAEPLAGALLFARSVTDDFSWTIYRRFKERDNKDEIDDDAFSKTPPESFSKMKGSKGIWCAAYCWKGWTLSFVDFCQQSS